MATVSKNRLENYPSRTTATTTRDLPAITAQRRCSRNLTQQFIREARHRTKRRASTVVPAYHQKEKYAASVKRHGAAPPPPAKQQKPANLFRKTARMVKNQLVWTKGLVKDAEEHLKTYVVESQGDGQPEALTFNLNAFRPDVQSCGSLTSRAKKILMKASSNRNEEDLKFLEKFTLRLKCFDRYPLYVRKELARVLYYEAFERGRVVIRQGALGFNFYFIVSGGVLVEVQEGDQVTGRKHNMIVGELGSGSSFGELALLHDVRRRATIVCKEDAEFLKVDKPDFDMVLRRNHEREWSKRLEYIKNHPLFAGWTPANLNFAVEGSHIIEYPQNTVIFKDLSQPPEKVFIIMYGNCKVVQNIELLEYVGKESRYQKEKVILPPINPTSAINKRLEDKLFRKVNKWWVLRTLHPEDYFGVGEGQEGMSVISDHKVECLLVNKMVFMKHERGKCLSKMQAEAAKLYPSRDMAFKSYLETKKWKEYKRDLIIETVRNQKRCHVNHFATLSHK